VKTFPLHPPHNELPSAEIDQLFLRIFERRPDLKVVAMNFQTKPIIDVLGVPLKAALEEMRQSEILRLYFRSSLERTTAAQSSYYHSKCMSAHFLVLTRENVPEGYIGWLREACWLTLLIFWNANTQLHGRKSKLYKHFAADLKAALVAADWRRLLNEYPLLLIWMCFLGAFISRHKGDQPWFVATISEFARARPTITWDELVVELNRFLYIEDIYGRDFRQIWKDAKSVSASEFDSGIQ